MLPAQLRAEPERPLRLPALLLLAACSDYDLTGTDKAAGGDGSGTSPLDSGTAPSCADPDLAEMPFTVDESCLVEPGEGSFEPVIEWQWSTHPTYPDYHQIMSTPAVANLTDDDGDGDIDEDDIPEVIFNSFKSSGYTIAGVLTAISGDGGALVWAVDAPGGYPIYASSGVAVGDLEGDGSPDVCVAGTTASVVCLEADGSFKWASGATPYYVGCPAIADMDGDGRAEVIFGNLVFDFLGNQVGEGAGGVGGRYMSFAVDMDQDGDLEVVAGSSVYEMDGTLVWDDGLGDGIPAVGDFDGDGLPEVVRTTGSTVVLTDTDGTVLWQVSVPGTGGGAPTVADFDGDGEPEVGVAGLALYTVFDTDGTVLWSNPTQDASSSVTGSSVFDFDRDGSSEVVYADEQNLWVYDGATGAVKIQLDGHASGTLFEYPIIADVDHDGSTEIVVASNNYAFSGWTGITVIGDETSSWAPARPIWNQFAYHITNVEGDGKIPKTQTENWKSWNSFRAGGTEIGPSDWLADLSPGEPEICLDRCAEDLAILWIPVGNGGLLDALPSRLAVESAAATTPVALAEIALLASGASAWAGPFTIERATWGGDPLRAVADYEEAVEECDEEDNTLDLGGWPCP